MAAEKSFEVPNGPEGGPTVVITKILESRGLLPKRDVVKLQHKNGRGELVGKPFSMSPEAFEAIRNLQT